MSDRESFKRQRRVVSSTINRQQRLCARRGLRVTIKKYRQNTYMDTSLSDQGEIWLAFDGR